MTSPADPPLASETDAKSVKIYTIPSGAVERPAPIAELSAEQIEKQDYFLPALLAPIQSLPEDKRHEIEEKVTTILKSAGLDGPNRKKIRQVNGAIHDGDAIRHQAENRLLAFIRTGEDGYEDRIQQVFELALETESFLQEALKSKAALGIKKIRDTQSQYKNSHGKIKEKIRQRSLQMDGIDLQHDPIGQHTRTFRNAVWMNGPQNVIKEINNTILSIDHLREPFSPAKEKAGLEEKDGSSALLQHGFMSADEFDRVPRDADLSTAEEKKGAIIEKISIILKAAGIDGPDIGNGLTPSRIPQNSDAGELIRKRKKIKGDLSEYINADKSGAEDRINHLFDLARKTEHTLQELSNLPARKRNLELLIEAKNRFDDLGRLSSFSPSQKDQYREELFIKLGIDVYQGIPDQDRNRQRLEIWSFGVKDLTDDFDSVVATIRAQIKSAEVDNFSSRERLNLAAQKRNLERLERSRAKALKKKERETTCLHPEPKDSAPDYATKDDTQLRNRQHLQEILNAEKSKLFDLRDKIEIEQKKIPASEKYLDEQMQLLEMAREDFEALRQSALLLNGRKKGILASLTYRGRDVSEYGTAQEIETMLNRRAEEHDLPEDSPEAPAPSPASDNSDLEGLEDAAPELCAQIMAVRAEHDTLAKIHFEAQAENARLDSQAKQAERNTNRLLKATEQLTDAKIGLDVQLAQLTYMLDDFRNQKQISDAFNQASKYPPLSEIGAWVRENLDESRIVVHSAAIKNTESSLYSEPELVYQALELLMNEGWELQTSGSLDEDERKRKREKYQAGLDVLSLTDTFSNKIRWRTDIGKKYISSMDGKKYKLDHHLGKGAGSDARRCFRLYYAWDGEKNRVVVGHMPDHLPTGFM